MKATVVIQPTPTLINARHGDFFIAHSFDLDNCICVKINHNKYTPPMIFHEQLECIVVLVPFRDSKVISGDVHFIHHNTRITFLEQVEPFAFRERGMAPIYLGDGHNDLKRGPEHPFGCAHHPSDKNNSCLTCYPNSPL